MAQEPDVGGETTSEEPERPTAPRSTTNKPAIDSAEQYPFPEKRHALIERMQIIGHVRVPRWRRHHRRAATSLDYRER